MIHPPTADILWHYNIHLLRIQSKLDNMDYNPPLFSLSLFSNSSVFASKRLFVHTIDRNAQMVKLFQSVFITPVKGIKIWNRKKIHDTIAKAQINFNFIILFYYYTASSEFSPCLLNNFSGPFFLPNHFNCIVQLFNSASNLGIPITDVSNRSKFWNLDIKVLGCRIMLAYWQFQEKIH